MRNVEFWRADYACSLDGDMQGEILMKLLKTQPDRPRQVLTKRKRESWLTGWMDAVASGKWDFGCSLFHVKNRSIPFVVSWCWCCWTLETFVSFAFIFICFECNCGEKKWKKVSWSALLCSACLAGSVFCRRFVSINNSSSSTSKLIRNKISSFKTSEHNGITESVGFLSFSRRHSRHCRRH